MITIDVKELLICLVLVALFVLIVYAVLLVRKLLKTVDETNKVVDDATVVSKIAATKATELDGIITDVSGTISNLSHELNDKQGLIKTATNVGKAAASAVSYLKDRSEVESEKLRRKASYEQKKMHEKKKRIFGK